MSKIIAGADIHAGDGGYSIGTQEEYEKFVAERNRPLIELVARECASIADEYDGAGSTIASRILKRFGIEQ